MAKCPECDSQLMPVLNYKEDGYDCFNCDWHGTADEVVVETGSPLDVRANPERVDVRFPDPRRYCDETSWQCSPDAARRLAEALLQAAEDAERREYNFDGEIGDGFDSGVDL